MPIDSIPQQNFQLKAMEFFKGFGISSVVYAICYFTFRVLLPKLPSFDMLLAISIFTFVPCYSVGVISYSLASFKERPSKAFGMSFPAIVVVIWMGWSYFR